MGKEGISLPEWAKIVYPKDLEQLEQNIRDIKNQVIDNHDMEYRIVDKKGNKVWISCRGTVVKDKESQPAFLMGSISELAMAVRWIILRACGIMKNLWRTWGKV